MGGEIQDGLLLHAGLQLALVGGEEALQEPVPFLASMPKSLLIHNGRPNSMVVKKPREPIPPHIVAEAISTLHGLDLRWSGPITPSERQYVEQYVLAKYPHYSHGLVEEGDKTDLYSIFLNDDGETCSRPEGGSDQYLDRRRTSPRGGVATAAATAQYSPSFGGSNLPDPVEKTRLEPSRLLDILTKKASFPGSFVSIPEIHARNRVLGRCGLAEEDYLVLFTPGHKEAMMLVGESYPFFRYNYYMTTLQDQDDQLDRDCVREFAAYKEAKVIAAPADWLDLRIKGSQLSQYFRRKCKHRPKGLFAYAAAENIINIGQVDGAGGIRRNSMHWVSEAHRNGWHVLLDASSSGAAVGGAGEGRLNLALHRPDFVLCTLDNAQRTHPPTVTCLLVRREAFDTTTPSPP